MQKNRTEQDMQPKSVTRRNALAWSAGLAALSLLPPWARAQDNYPAKAVTLILSFPPGAIVDNVGRKLAAALTALWKVPVVCDNRPGAGGNLAGGIVAKAPPDGYTLLLSQYDSMVIAKAGNASIGYDPLNDLVPVAQVGLSTTLFLVNANSPFKTFPEFIAYAKANPGKLNFGSNGHGGSYHLGIEQLNSIAKTSITHIPYKGGAPSMMDLLAGRVDAILASTSLAQPQLKAGKVRLLALGSARRSPLYPGVPTIAELGNPGYDTSLGLGVFAPQGTPAAVVQKLNRDINTALADSELRQQLAVEGVDPTNVSQAQFHARLTSDVNTTASLLKQLNIRLE